VQIAGEAVMAYLIPSS